MAKKINLELSERSIQEAIDMIEAYKRSLDSKVNQLIQRLTAIGIETVNAVVMSVAPVDRGDYSVTSVYNQGGNAVCGAMIQLTGDQILFIEFSAGITFGTDSFKSLPNNPNYGQGYGAGTYPGKGHWNDPTGWWYVSKWGEPVHTYGVRAYAPMYNADIEMRRQIQAIAREVFGG